jgi:hypothetical protein
MAWSRTWGVPLLAALFAGCATSSAPPAQRAGGDAPDEETQHAVFDLILISSICLKHNQPNRDGEVVLAVAFSNPGTAVEVFDTASTPGNERAVACAIEQARRVKSPRSPPSRFAVYNVPFPFRAEAIRIYFPPTRPTPK